ncbi:hypothetical protein BMS3Abin10_00289 [bacterium BMS3Abin10]|nr:hypothetical protein BMS3Abin10_00289 [bacterium BMS3Abin10]GBE37560.1 hypothetical protein BMS3Bbin08_00150 [bacterium BMS3Bbin08]HDK42538.1 hypothetical protein [Candidatus Pacearchaeota archaeon]
MKYLSESPQHSPGVKRWQILLGMVAFIIILGIFYYIPINTQPNKEQITKQREKSTSEIKKVTYFVKSQTELSDDDALNIAYRILNYYWERDPKEFTCTMVELLGTHDLTATTGDQELDKITQEVRQELKQSGIDPNKKRLTFKVDFIINGQVGTDVFNVYLPGHDIEMINTR